MYVLWRNCSPNISFLWVITLKIQGLMLWVSAYRFVRISMAIKLHASNYKAVTYVYNNLRRWDLHHCLPHELANPFMYSSCLKCIDKSSNKVVWSCLTAKKIAFLTGVNKRSSLQNTEEYGKIVNIFELLTWWRTRWYPTFFHYKFI